ncbi:protein AHNAK2 [Candoia aspera]|uniref:protein AHNAK2 n=1 Tax=Candoia aspera TaxID=51853 RepID=UPI002FD85080
MSDSQESMEVTLQTDVESGASGFSVAGGGAEGIFVKQVLKESPASKLFSLKEGDQLLSATIFFDNIKYEDALKILQYSEPYKVQFNLKRKLVGKDELETIHSATQSKKEKLSQGRDTLEISEKTISEEDKTHLIVKQRVGRQKRPKKDRLSWPKFQSIKGKKILGHRRSRSTSDAYEHGIPDVSPTSTDTESQFQPEEIHGKTKKQSQKKLKFPTIGFKMYKSKQEPYEVNPFKEYENDTNMELPEVMTGEDTTSLDIDRKARGKQELKRDVSDTIFQHPQHIRKYPDVELTITTSKDKKAKSSIEFTKQEPIVPTSQMKTAVIQTKHISDSQTKVSQNIPKIRKKKKKDSRDKSEIETQSQKEEKGKEINIASKCTLTHIEGAKPAMDINWPQVDISLHKADHKATKSELKMGEIAADINISVSDLKSPTDQAILGLQIPDQETNAQSVKIPVEGSDITQEDEDGKFKMLKFQKPKFGISLPKGKGVPEGEVTLPSVEADLPKTGLKAEVTLPSADLEADIKLPGVEVEAPSLDVEVGEKGKIKMPGVKMPSVKVAKLVAPEVGISLPKVEADISLPKGKAELPEGELAVKVPEAGGTTEGGGMKIHMPKFKMPSMGFSKPDIKGPKVDVDVSMPKMDISLPETELHVAKPKIEAGKLVGDISISAPEVKIPTGQASLDLEAPDVDVEAPSGKVALQGPDIKMESGDSKFKMPKFQMPKFGISLPKGKGVPEGEVTLPSVEADLPKTGLKAEVTLPSADLEADIKLPGVEVEAPSLDVEVGEKGKIKMPGVKMPSVKVPKLKAPEVGISLPKVEADVSLPKGKAELPEGELAVKAPEAGGTTEGGGMKIHMPKFKMPSMGFSKPDIKGPKADVDVSMPKMDISLPETELHVAKPKIEAGKLVGDISISAPEVKIPMGQASLDLEAPDVDVEAPSGKVALQGPDIKMESGDSKFKMPKFQMPKFGISLPKGKGVPEGEVTLPSVEADLPKTGLKAEVTLPSADLEADIKLPGVEVEAPSLDVEVGEKGKIKMPGVKMPSVKVPKLKAPEVGISLPKVEADVSLPKGKAELPEGELAVKAPEAGGTTEGGGMKIHMPKFKMPSMGFSKPDIKGPKVDVDVSMPKMDISLPETELHVAKPKIEAGKLVGDISISAPEVKIPTGQASLDLEAPDVDVEAPSGKVALQGPDIKMESGDSKFKMPKFQMPKFGISLPKGKGVPEGEVTLPSVEADLPKTGLKAEVTLPSADLEADIKLPGVEVEAPSLDVEVGEKGKIKMPGVKMPSVKVPKLKAPEVGISLPKVEADVSLPKGKAELPEGELAVKVPEAGGTTEGGGMKIHMPKFKMPSMGFSKPDIKGPKADVDVSMPKMDISLPETELHVAKPKIEAGKLVGDISISAPEVKIPTGQASLDLEAPDVDVEAPSGKVALQGPDIKMESGDSKFKMPKFQMPKFGISLPKGKGVPEGEVTLPSVEADLPKTGLKAEVTLPSADLEADIKLPGVEVEAPSLDVEVGEKGKIKMPGVKMPSVKVPKLKAPEVGISLPKVEADVSLPKGKAELPEGELAVKVPEAGGTTEGGGMKIHMPKFKMPSMGFSKPDIKGPKVDVNISMPKMDISLPETELHVAKPKIEAGKLVGDISISAPEVKIPTGQASLDLEAPDVDVEAPSGKVALQGPDIKMESGDSKFKMPKFQMPKFGISLPKGKGVPEGEVTLPSVEADLPKTGLKAEVTLPSADLEADIKLPGVEVEAPSLDVEVGEKGKIKMPGVKMPSVKVPKLKAPEVGISLPKVEADVSLPKGKAELPEGELAVKVPEAGGTTEGGGMKIHMPKFKMPSMGFSKPDIKGPKADVDVSMPKMDISLPETELHVAKPKIEAGKLVGDISISAPEVKIPTGQASLDLEAPDVDVEAPSGKVALQGPDIKMESGDSKFKMPKFQMPKFGISLPKGKGVPEGEVTLPSVEADLPKTGLKAEVTLPSADLEADIKLPGVEVEAPSLDVEVGEKGKIKMPGVKMPSVKVPKLKAPEVGISLPKVEADVSLPKGKAELPEGELAVKVPEAEGTTEGGGMKIHMPKFKMPSMGFSKPDIKGPKVDVDVSMPKMDISLPETELHVAKPKIEAGKLVGDISISAPEVKFPTGQVSLDLDAADVDVEAPSGKVALQGPGIKMESGDSKFKMPKFQMPKFGISLPKGKGVPEGEVTLPSVEADLPKTGLKAEVTLPSADLEADIKLPGVEVEAPSLDVEVGEKGKIKMPGVKMPSVKVAKLVAPEVGISQPKVEADISLPKGKPELPEGELAVKVPEAEGTTEGGGMKIHMPKFKMPSMGFSKPDIKGPKVDVDVSMPKMDISLPETELHVAKPKIEAGKLVGDISISAPEVKIPTGQASLDLEAPDVDVEAPSGKVALQGPDIKMESGDSKFKMPKFQMPKFGISLPKGKGVPEGEVTLPSVEADLPKTGLKAEVTLLSADLEADIKLPGVEVEAPSLDVEVGEKGKIKMPGVKMPSVKVPKLKAPEVGISLPKVEADVSLPKGKAELPEGELDVKVPEAGGTTEGGGMKIHMPKFKMPSMGFSKPDIKGPKADVDVSMPKMDISLPETELHVAKPKIEAGKLVGDISISAPEVKIPTGQASLDLEAPDVDVEAPSGKVALQGPDIKMESGDSKFKMPKFQMPKFGISLPKGKGVPEGEVTLPSVEADLPKTGLKAEVTLPSADLEADIKLPGVEVEAPSLDVELPKGELAVKVPEAEGTTEGGGMKIHMPKFKMPSMGFSKPDIKGPKVDVDVSMPKMDISLPVTELHVAKPKIEEGKLVGDISISAPKVKIPTGQASLDLEAPDVDVEAPSGKVALQGPDIKMESGDSKFKMPKFQMPKFGISLPKGKGVPEGEVTLPSVEADLPKTGLKAEVTLPSADLEADIKFPGVEVEAPSLDVEVGEKGKIKMPGVKMPSVKVPKLKAPEVGISLPKVEADVSLPKGKAELPEGELAVKVPEAGGTTEGGGMKIHMPKFKMPSMGFSKPDIKGPKVDVDISMPKMDISLPETELHVAKPKIEAGKLVGDISISAPEVKIPTGQASLDLEAPDVDVEAPSGKVALQGPDIKMESGDSKFKMPKFQMPKFGISLPKGKGVPEGEVTLPSVEADLPKTGLKAEVTLPSADLEADIKLPGVEVEAPSLDVEVGEKGKIKMPGVKMPSVKVPKLKAPEVGISLPKVEADVSLPKGKAELPEGELAVKVPEAGGTTEGGGMKIHMPKFKMPSMGFSKPDIKGPKVDVDISMPKMDISLPETELHVAKPKIEAGKPVGDISISAPEVKIPTGQASLDLEAPDIDVEAPSGKVALQGPDIKMESGDSKFKMPKFQMPKLGISLPKGKGVPQGEVTLPSVEADLPKTGLKAEVTLPSADLEADIKLPGVEVEAPSLDVEVGEKGKIKMPGVKMPSVKVPKLKAPEVGISLPKVEADVSLPKGKAELPEGELAVKVPEAGGTTEGGGMKIHMPKFKMPSMGFSKPDIKGPKVDVAISMPKMDISLPETELHVAKPKIEAGKLVGDISISAPEVKIPTGQASLDLEAPDVDVEAPSGKVALQGPDIKMESGDSKFKMPKFQMPKFGISLPKGKGVPEGEVTLPSVEADLPKTGLKAEVTLPSADLEADIKLPGVEVEAPSLDVEVGEKGKIKMPGVKMPSVKVPKLKAPEVGISLPKVEADVSLPKGKAELPEGELAVKVPEAGGTTEGGGMKIHMPKFKMPSMGFSKPDIKGPKVDMDVSMPKMDISLPETELHVAKPKIEAGKPVGDISISAPEVKIPTGQASLDLEAPDIDVEAPSGKVALQGPDIKMESGDSKFKMPKFQMPKLGISLPKGKGVPQGEVTLPSVEADLPKTGLKAEVTLPSADLEADIKLPGVEVEAPSLDVEVGEKGKIKMPGVKMPSVKVPKLKAPEVGISLPKVEADVSLPKGKGELSDGEAAIKVAGAEGSHEKGRMKIHMPKFKMPSMGFSKPDIKGPKIDVDVSMPDVHVSLPTAELSTMKPDLKTDELAADISISQSDIKIPTGQATLELKAPDVVVEAPSGKVDVEGSEVKVDSGDSKFKMPKFQMPKLGISLPKGKGIPAGEITLPSMETDVPKPGLNAEIQAPSASHEADLKLPEVEIGGCSLNMEVGEKGKVHIPGVEMSSAKIPKVKAAEIEITLPNVEADISPPKRKAEVPEAEVAFTVPIAEVSHEKSRVKMHMPKFKMPSMGFSKPDIKGPKVDVDVSMTDVSPKAELSTIKSGLKTDNLEGSIRTAAPEVKIPGVPVTVELKAPDIGVQDCSGKVPDTDIGLPKDIDVPQLKITTDITDIAVEVPTFEMESGVPGEKKNVLEEKIKMPQILRVDVKTGAVDIPPVDVSVAQSEVGTQDLHAAAKEPETKGEIKSGSLDGEEKGHFKMPKFKLPSLSWSPKKEASLKTNIKELLEESKVAITSDDTGTEPKVNLSEDQGVHIDQSIEIATRKGQVKRPHIIMPKISRSKAKLPKAEVDIVVEGEGASVQIPDIENSFTTRKVEETEISVKILKDEIKEEIKMFQTDTDINLSRTDIKVPLTKSSFEQKSLETGFKGDVYMDNASMKSDGTEGKFSMPKLKMPEFGISHQESDVSGSGITLPKTESDVSQFQTTTESDKLGRKAQPLDVKNYEANSEEIQTEESQSWFKMPKFKMPSFGRTSSKTKKSDAETEDSTGKALVTELQVEVKSPKVVTTSPHVELDIGKDIVEPKVVLPQEDIIIQKEKQPKTDLLVGEGSFLQSLEKAGRKLSDLEIKTYADVVKHGAEGQSLQIHKPEFIGPTSEITVPKMDIDINIPKSEMTLQQHKVILDTMEVAEVPSTEITMGRKIDPTITDTEPLQSLDTQPEEMGSEKKSPKKDTQGKESIFKMPTFSVPLFGWSTTKSNAILPGIVSDLEEPAVALSKVKMGVSITDEDFEIIDFPTDSFEKDLPTEDEVKAEEKQKSSKTKASKFKIPKFANLHSKSQGAEVQVDPPKVQTEVSLVKLEGEIPGIQVEDKKPGDTEVSFHIPKFKMPKFTHRISEGETLTSEETMDIKYTTDDISQLQFRTMSPEEKGDTGYDIQKSKVRITTLSEPAIQRPQVGIKLPSTDSPFADTTVCIQVPKEFGAEFLTEKIDTIDGNIQKSVAKITTLREPDIQRAPLEIKLQSDDPFSPSAPVQVQGSYTESKEIKMEGKSTFGYGDDAEIQESFSTQIVKESEILPSEVKTAAFGFSLLKVKIQESHVSLHTPVKLSSTECMEETFEGKDHQLSGSGKSTQKSGLDEVKPSGKDKDITCEFTEGASSATTLTKLKDFTVEVQSSSEFAESHSEPIEISKSVEFAEETKFTSSTEEPTDEKEKLDSKRSSGRFKLWFPSIGFSSTADDTKSDSKPEAQQEIQSDDSLILDSDTAKQTEKTGWFRFPKLGFSSPTKKSKEVDKEKETDPKEGKDEESPTEKSETFFDAQETLSLKEKEENETSGDIPSEPIVSSSARTELILLEKGKGKPQPIPEDSSN